MQTRKAWLKKVLIFFHLYNFAHRLVTWKSDLPMYIRNAGYRIVGAPDGFPIPPMRLIYQVILSKEIAYFLISGFISKRCISSLLNKNGYRFDDFHNILDFGCGCGRILRHWRLVDGQHLFGTDYNQDLIAWCQKGKNLKAQFKKNQSSPPLDYTDGMFDFIYALSVFTHLSEDLQFAWIRELTRVLKPGGLLYITVHGASRLYTLNEDERRQFHAGELIVKQESKSGLNDCCAYHPEQYIRNKWGKELSIIDFVRVGQIDMDQDVYLFKKPTGTV